MEFLLYYLYDETGLPIGLKYRTSAYEAGVFDCFFFEKNLQGDIIAVYNSTGKRIGTYTYDAWGNFNYSLASGNTALETRIVFRLNPFRYRGYYYDHETGFYYLQSRYYNPEWGRFLNADGYINANGDILGFNMFAYCGNNPVMGYDPTGEWNWRLFLDMVVSAVSVSAGAVVGASVDTIMTVAQVPVPVASTAGIAAGVATTGTINNTVNAVYYHFSDGISDLEQDLNASSYVTQGYIDRWSRLDYVKSQLGGEYNSNAWRYYSEYNFHMYAWMATGWAYDESGANKSLFSKVAASAYKADIDPYHWDSRAKVNIPTVIIGVFGL